MFVQVLLIVAIMLTVTMVFYQWFGRKYDLERQQNRQIEQLASHSNSVEALSFGYSKAVDLILEANDHHSLKEAFRQADFDWQQRAEICVIARRGYHPKVIQQWRIEQPTADAFLMNGISQLHMAIGLQPENSDAANSCASNAANDLLQAAEQLPHDPTPWAYLINVVTCFPQTLEQIALSPLGNSHGLRNVDAIYQHAKQLDSKNWLLDTHYAISLSPLVALNADNTALNTGNMLAFANKLADELDEGDPRFSVVFRALAEDFRWRSERAQSGENVVISSEQRDLGEKCANLLLGAGKSIEQSPTQFFAYCNAAAWFWMCRDTYKLPQFLAPINEQIRPIHWQWLQLEHELGLARQLCQLPEPTDADF